TRTKVAADKGRQGLCRKDRPAPALAAISRPERQEGRLKTIVDRNDDRPIGLHERLATDDTGLVGRRQCRSPCLAPIGGGAHLHTVDLAKVVELGIAVTEEGAAGRIVADAPVFVVKIPGSID